MGNPYDQFTEKANPYDQFTAKPEDSLLQRTKEFIAPYGMGEAAASLASGAVATPVAGIAGLGQAAANAVGVGTKDPGERVHEVQNALTMQPTTKVGRAITETVAAPFEWLAGKADKAGSAVAEATDSPAAGAAVNTAIQALPMIVSKGAKFVPPESAASIAARTKQQSLNAPRDAGLLEAKKEGLIVPPTQSGASPILRMIEGLAGEPKTAKLASKKNAPVINDLVRKDVGLPDDQPISREGLAKIRADEGQRYEAVKNIGQITTDPQYFTDFANITKSYDTAAKDFKHRSENPFKATLEGLTKDGKVPKAGFDAASLVEEVKLLRADADTAYGQRNPGLGKAFKSAANALDDMLERHVQKLAQTDPKMAEVAKDYLAARTRIAKTYAADKALNDSTGNINADVYAKAFKAGKPLSDEGRAVGKFAAQFPRSAQRIDKLGSTGATMFDIGMAGLGAAGSAFHPYLAGVAAASMRPIARQAMTMRTANPPTYGPGTIRKLMDLHNEALAASAVGATAGQRGNLRELKGR